MSGQLIINFVFGTAIGFLLAQWFFARHDHKLMRMSFNALQQTIADLVRLAEEEKQK